MKRKLFSKYLNFHFSFVSDMAQNVLQVHRMQHGTQHENIQGFQQESVL